MSIKLNSLLNKLSNIGGMEDKFPRLRRFFGIKAGEKLSQPAHDCVQISDNIPKVAESDVISVLAAKTRGNQKVFADTMAQIVNDGTKNNPELKAKRLEYLRSISDADMQFVNEVVLIGLENPKQAAFLIDNQKEINEILNNKKLSDFVRNDLLAILNKENYPKFVELSKDADLTGLDFASRILYGAKKHIVAFGDKKVTVPADEIVSLLTGYNSPSVLKTGSYDTFNSVVQKLVADGYKTDNPQYHQIVEGILTQNPELVKIADEYIKYNKFLGRAKVQNPTEHIKRFFEYQVQNGLLPKELEFKTIIPDENALDMPKATLSAFKYMHGIK